MRSKPPEHSKAGLSVIPAAGQLGHRAAAAQDLKLFTPTSSGKRAFPIGAAVALGIGDVVAIFTEPDGGGIVAHHISNGEVSAIVTEPDGVGVGVIVHVVARVIVALALCSMGSWLEQRIYTRLLAKGRAIRLTLSLLLPIAALIAGPLLAILGALGAILGDEGTLVLGIVAASWWVASAAMGSAFVVALDMLLSALISDFRSRIQAAVLGLVAFATMVAVAMYALGRELAFMLQHADPKLLKHVTVDLGDDDILSPEEVQRLASMPETATLVTGGVVMLSVLVALPALLSACGKLGDAVMERLNPLAEAFREAGRGNLKVKVEEGGSRELRRITAGFNQMASSLSETLSSLDVRNHDLSELNRATSRFVPFQFLELLGKNSLGDIKRGDQIKLEISVLFSDIRGFTSMAERVGPQVTFDFINRYLGCMEEEIHREQGFINDIIGDGIMALFHRGADSALRAASGMLSALEQFNESLIREGGAAIQIGIGMNSGPLMLGTIGGAERLSCTVVGDPANLAARVESMTKLYGVPLLISGKTYAGLQAPERFRIREVDRVVARGKNEAVSIYEVLVGEPKALLEQKWQQRGAFQQILKHYRAGDFAQAARDASAYLETVPEDTVASLYAQRLEALQHSPPADWPGVTRL